MYYRDGLAAAPVARMVGSPTTTTTFKPQWYANKVTLEVRAFPGQRPSDADWLGPFLSASQGFTALLPFKQAKANLPVEKYAVNNLTGEILAQTVANASAQVVVPSTWKSYNYYDKLIDATRQSEAVKWSIAQGRIDLPGTIYFVHKTTGAMWRVVPPASADKIIPDFNRTTSADYAQFEAKADAIAYQKSIYAKPKATKTPGFWVFQRGGVWLMSQGYLEVPPSGIDTALTRDNPTMKFFPLNQQGAAIAYMNARKGSIFDQKKPPVVVTPPVTTRPPVPVLPPLVKPDVAIATRPPVPVTPPREIVTVKPDQPVNVITPSGDTITVDATTVAEATPVVATAETATPAWLWLALAGGIGLLILGGKGRAKRRRRAR